MARRLWVLGDSWTDPSWGGWAWEAGWPALIARRLGLTLVNTGRSGAGYVSPSAEGATYVTQAASGAGAGADAVIVWGSLNDYAQPTAQVRSASAQTHAALRAACPGAVLLVYGPEYWDTQPWPGVYAARQQVRASAQEAGALFVDPILWMQGRGDLIDTTAHPNQAGHRLIAGRVELDLWWALGPSRGDTSPHWTGGYRHPWVSPLAAAAATMEGS